jgi:hypothetical protein
VLAAEASPSGSSGVVLEISIAVSGTEGTTLALGYVASSSVVA